MLTLQDCIGICELTEEEIKAIAQHEHVPDIIAAELGEYMIHSKDGVPHIRKIILDDIEHARAHGHEGDVEKLKLVLKHFIATHPDRPKVVDEAASG
jgi:hypothetical protein